MSSNEVNYDINSYSLEELINILQLTIPVTKKEIENAIAYHSARRSQDKDLVEFLKKAKAKFNAYFEANNLDIIEEDSGSGFSTISQLKEGYKKGIVGDRIGHNVTVVNPDRSVQIRNYLNQQNLPIKQGYMNPVLRQSQIKILTIDSAYRNGSTSKQVISVSPDLSGNCVTTVQNNYVLPQNSGSFIINLEEPLVDVISIKVISYEIPVSWYPVDSAYGTNVLEIKLSTETDWNTVTLPPGKYVQGQTMTIQDELQKQIRTVPGFGAATVTYNLNDDKITIENGGVNFDLRFFDENYEFDNCSDEEYNSTLRENLGYLCGFRFPVYTGQNSYTGEAAVNLDFFNYLFISVNDFNSNFTNKIFLHAFDFDQPIISTAPAYYNSTLYPTDISGNNVYISDPSGNLTQAQKYSVEQILTEQYLNKQTPAISNNQTDSNTLARIVNNESNTIDSLKQKMSYLKGKLPSSMERTYFGPVNIEKLEVKLINDKGRIVNLNYQDWSFALEITQLYQF